MDAPNVARTMALAAVTSLCALLGVLALASASASALETHAFSKSFAGEGEHALSDPQGVAIDQSTGEVYVVDGANDRVEVFSASGTFVKAFGSAGEGPGQFKEPTQIAVDDSTGLTMGDVYVLDKGNERVEVFNAKDEYLRLISVAALPKPPAMCFENIGQSICEEPGQDIGGVAVDASGDLWILGLQDGAESGYLGQQNVYEFSPGGTSAGHRAFSAAAPGYNVGGGPKPGLAADPSGDLYTMPYSRVQKFEPDGDQVGEDGIFFHMSSNAGAVAIDPATGDLYVDEQSSVAHYLAPNTGQLNDRFGFSGPDALAGGTGLAVDGVTGEVYVAEEAGNRVDVFTPTSVAEVTVEAATGVEQTTATLHGSVNPDEIPVSACEFEWGTEQGRFTHAAPCSPTPPYTGDVAQSVQAGLDELMPATTYFYRLVATDANGTGYPYRPEEESFTTPPAVQGLTTGPAEGVTPTGAKLTGSLSPDGTDAHYYFEYSTSETIKVPCSEAEGCFESPHEPGVDAGSGGPKCKSPGDLECSPVSAETTLASLAPDTVYHYRLVGVDSFGTTYGADATLKTPGDPTIESASAEVQPENKAGQTSATLQAQINPHGRETTYHFEYGETTSYGTSIPAPPGAIGSGETLVSVPTAELSGLKLGTTYHYRVVAANAFGTVYGPDQMFTTLAAALVEASVSDVASTSATLNVQVNPLGTATTCQFQYVIDADFNTIGYETAVSAPCPADLGEGETRVSESMHLQDLAAGTVYHYRVVATNALGTVDSSDQTFTTQGAGTALKLPDGRTWEMVSPPEKEGALIMAIGEWSGEGSAIQASAGGGAISYPTSTPTEAEPQGFDNFAQDLSRRSADGGWSTQDITPPNAREIGTGQLIGRGTNYRLFSSDLLLAVVQPAGAFTPLSPEASEETAYLRTNFLDGEVGDPCVSGCYRPLVTGKPGYANVPPGTSFGSQGRGAYGQCLLCGPQFAGATPDLSHVILEAGGLTETPWTDGGSSGLYEWSTGKPPSEQLRPLYQLPKSEGGDGDSEGQAPSPLTHQLSDDGSAFFSYRGHLYLHDVAKGEAVRLDVAQGVAEPSEGDAKFLYASSDGSTVLFSDSKQLTKAPGGGVYECRIVEADGALTCGELALTDLSGEGVVIGGSEDASYLYFVGSGNRLYVDHRDGAEWTQTSIATLSQEDENDWATDGNGGPALEQRTDRVSPNGQWLVFMSSQDLTGYSTRDAISGHADEEVYLYDASANRLVCASCDPTGGRPVGERVNSEVVGEGVAAGDGGVEGGRWLAASIPGWTPYELSQAFNQTRYLSDSGRLFFNSYGALVPQDVNGTWDVYEYEPPGVGDCETSSATFGAQSDGCVGLISSGTSAEESEFLEASEDGGDVFFLTAAQLAPQDRDTALDVYDAHECTELAPCPATTTTPPPCTTGDACKPAATPQPTLFGAPSSETFSGAGNVAPASTESAATPKSSRRAQKLKKALKACKRRPKRKRAACERRARRANGSASKAKRSRKGGR